MERVLVQLQLTVFAVVTSTVLVSIIGTCMQSVHAESCVTEDLFRHCGFMIIDVS